MIKETPGSSDVSVLRTWLTFIANEMAKSPPLRNTIIY